ncbi:iduronate 2-sulfatase-like [Ruditapes philippinarum]|uniref:iduronate 2-sulfatase-like n=1 Tax=Ruditapes philippinarum TaxID=129788 RepID=UPI00295B052F|nr:iduronate 2-sulfatase-like [Ruditapes philippinarum]
MRPQLGAYAGKNFPAPVSPEMHTPNLDGLASRSLLLERAYVQEALCSPSRTSLLTGRRPDTTRVWEIGPYFRDVGGNFTTLPEYFKMNGYRAVGMGKIFHPGKASGGDDPISWSEPYFHGINNFEGKNNSWFAVPDELLVNQPLRDQQIADQAIKTLKRLAPAAKSGKQPFFIAAGFHKPHLPFVFPKSFLKYYPTVKLPDNPYAPVNMPEAAWFNYWTLRGYEDIKKLHKSGAINTTLPDDVVVELRRAYYSAISFTDSLVGSVLAELENLGLANNTIVSFWGDHGYQLGEHGEWTKHTNFELSVHAPMMLHVPGLTDKGIKTDQLTEFVDLFPTLVEAAGLKPLPICPNNSRETALCREGTSLMPLIAQPDKPIKMASFSQYPRTVKKDVDGMDTMGYTVRTDRYRYTEWPKFKYAPDYKPKWNKLAGVELYDHLTDPEENVNHADDSQYTAIRKQLSELLHAGWRSAQIEQIFV